MPGDTGGAGAPPLQQHPLVTLPKPVVGVWRCPAEASTSVTGPGDGFLPRPGGKGGVHAPLTATVSLGVPRQTCDGHVGVPYPLPHPVKAAEASKGATAPDA